MLQLALTIIIFLIIVIPVGRYMYHIATWNHTLADPVFDRLDGVIYKIGGVNPHQGMNWRQYALALVGTNAVMVAIGYLILRIQSVGIFNPNSIGNMEPTLAFNTIISFMTNTNLQHYSGESGLSYLSQMLVIIFMMFVSAASGYAACIAFIRGLAGKSKDNVGNFFVDLVRITTRILLPFSIVGGTARVTGVGDILEPLKPCPPCFFTVCMPAGGISTPQAYARYDRIGTDVRPDSAAAAAAIARGDLAGLCAQMKNALEYSSASAATKPICETLRAHGALEALMTGSGAAVFGVFADEAPAQAAKAALLRVYPQCWVLRPEAKGARVVGRG
mgnify:CR=1 FL=1